MQAMQAMADLFPGSGHVREVGLATADDDDIWSYAAKRAHDILAFDRDPGGSFLELG